MLDFFRKKASPIGLDIGHNSIRMIQLAADGDNINVIAAGEMFFNPEANSSDRNRADYTITAIRQMLAQGSFVGREVVSCLSDTQLRIRSLRLDTAQLDDIDNILQSEMGSRFGLDPENDEIRYLLAGNIWQGEKVKNELILFAIENKLLKKHIAMLEAATLIPVGIDTAPLALFRSSLRILRRAEDEEKVNVLVEIGSEHTTVIMGRGSEIIFAKQIPAGGEKINHEIASKLGISIDEASTLRMKLRHDEACGVDVSVRQTIVDAIGSTIDELAREISLCFRYYVVAFRGERPQNIVFAGGEAYEETLIKALKRHLGVEVELICPLRDFDLTGIDFPGDKRGPLSEWTVAVGLSIKGFKPILERSGICERV
ncbi:MAG: pilus assembly protein PilM [Planctomycetes bacterium]|nr:pilus assembly protein PilM [Planctomycetota bacterium]